MIEETVAMLITFCIAAFINKTLKKAGYEPEPNIYMGDTE